MKIYCCYSRSHRSLFENFFLPSLPRNMELIVSKQEQVCSSAVYRQEKWEKAVKKKIPVIMDAIKENLGGIFVFSDVDVQFFGEFEKVLLEELGINDIAFQDERGMCCTGFFICRGNTSTLDFFQRVYDKLLYYHGDQETVNNILSEFPNLKISRLSHRFWTHAGANWKPPDDILVHHANCVAGIESKINLLDSIKRETEKRKETEVRRFPVVCCSSRTEQNGSVKNLFGVEYLFNQYDPDVDWMIDIGQKSKMSEKFPPEQRIWVHVEPEPYTYYFSNFEDYYKGGIFSWHPRVQDLAQTKKMIMGIRGVNSSFSTNKQFGVSGLISSKCSQWLGNLEKCGHKMEGYKLRKQILDRDNEISIPSMVWNFQKKWRGQTHVYPMKSKNDCMDYMFHFAIENCLEKNYFTEKITDCFLRCSIPLFFGDINAVAEHFNIDGVIQITETDWVEKVNSLTPKDYESRLPAMEENLSKALIFLQETTDVYKNISRIILNEYAP